MEKNNVRNVAIAGRIISEMIQATSAPSKMQSTRSINIPHTYLSKYGHAWRLCDTEQEVGGTCSFHGFDMDSEMLLLFWSSYSQHILSLL
jgi:hypothetical protein